MDVIAPTPPRGWNSFDAFGGQANYSTVLASANYMRSHLLEYGYEYIVVDAGWYMPPRPHAHDANASLDHYGRFVPFAQKFSRGFDTLAAELHAMGLKFGFHVVMGIPRLAVQRNSPILGINSTAAAVTLPRDTRFHLLATR